MTIGFLDTPTPVASVAFATDQPDEVASAFIQGQKSGATWEPNYTTIDLTKDGDVIKVSGLGVVTDADGLPVDSYANFTIQGSCSYGAYREQFPTDYDSSTDSPVTWEAPQTGEFGDVRNYAGDGDGYFGAEATLKVDGEVVDIPKDVVVSKLEDGPYVISLGTWWQFGTAATLYTSDLTTFGDASVSIIADMLYGAGYGSPNTEVNVSLDGELLTVTGKAEGGSGRNGDGVRSARIRDDGTNPVDKLG